MVAVFSKSASNPGCVYGVFLRLPLKGFHLRRLQREAPVQVDTCGSPPSSQGMSGESLANTSVAGFGYLA